MEEEKGGGSGLRRRRGRRRNEAEAEEGVSRRRRTTTARRTPGGSRKRNSLGSRVLRPGPQEPGSLRSPGTGGWRGGGVPLPSCAFVFWASPQCGSGLAGPRKLAT
eukprot:6347374-Pyramimonas_sp.AAC.2